MFYNLNHCKGLGLVIISITLCATTGNAALPASQVAALSTFFNTTGGPSGAWGFCDNGWLSNPNPCTWFGVTCNARGDNVVGLLLVDCGLTGSIPSALATLPMLNTLHLNFNAIGGSLPDELAVLTELTTLALDNNSLTGSLPSSYAALTKLQFVSLQHNAFSGTLPPEWSSLSAVTTLLLHGNQLSGPLPPSWGNMTALVTLQLNSNRLSGSLPNEWSLMSGLSILNLDSNQLSGEISGWNCSRSLTQLYLGNNAISGSLPSQWGDETSYLLTVVQLHNNFLSGTLNNTLDSGGAAFSVLSVANNQLSGELPPSWAGIIACYNAPAGQECVLDVSNNSLTGTPDAEAFCSVQTATIRVELNCLTDSGELGCNSSNPEQGDWISQPQKSTCA